jgi:hypothetical protein
MLHFRLADSPGDCYGVFEVCKIVIEQRWYDCLYFVYDYSFGEWP